MGCAVFLVDRRNPFRVKSLEKMEANKMGECNFQPYTNQFLENELNSHLHNYTPEQRAKFVNLARPLLEQSRQKLCELKTSTSWSRVLMLAEPQLWALRRDFNASLKEPLHAQQNAIDTAIKFPKSKELNTCLQLKVPNVKGPFLKELSRSLGSTVHQEEHLLLENLKVLDRMNEPVQTINNWSEINTALVECGKEIPVTRE